MRAGEASDSVALVNSGIARMFYTRRDDVAADILDCLKKQGFTPLSISVSDGQRAGSLPGPHKDLFDRMLIAQALSLDVPLVTNETIFDQYGIRRLW